MLGATCRQCVINVICGRRRGGVQSASPQKTVGSALSSKPAKFQALWERISAFLPSSVTAVGKHGPAAEAQFCETEAVFHSHGCDLPANKPSGYQEQVGDPRRHLGNRNGSESALRVPPSQPFRGTPLSLPRGKGEGWKVCT